MAIQTDPQIFNRANQISNETTPAANTKTRVGSLLFDMWDTLVSRLAGKANTTDVNNALNQKANLADVTDALNSKANTNDVTAALSVKADTSALQAEASARQAADSNLQALIDAISFETPNLEQVLNTGYQANSNIVLSNPFGNIFNLRGYYLENDSIALSQGLFGRDAYHIGIFSNGDSFLGLMNDEELHYIRQGSILLSHSLGQGFIFSSPIVAYSNLLISNINNLLNTQTYDVANNIIFSFGNLPAADFNNRNLYSLYDVSIDWGARIMKDASSNPSIDYGNRYMFDNLGYISIDYNSHFLCNFYGPVLRWGGIPSEEGVIEIMQSYIGTPVNPVDGYKIFVDYNTGELKALAPNGNITVIATP